MAEANTVVGRRAGQRARGGRLRVVAFLALAICVALVGVGGGALAGVVFGSAHGAQPSASNLAAVARATRHQHTRAAGLPLHRLHTEYAPAQRWRSAV